MKMLLCSTGEEEKRLIGTVEGIAFAPPAWMGGGRGHTDEEIRRDGLCKNLMSLELISFRGV